MRADNHDFVLLNVYTVTRGFYKESCSSLLVSESKKEPFVSGLGTDFGIGITWYHCSKSIRFSRFQRFYRSSVEDWNQNVNRRSEIVGSEFWPEKQTLALKKVKVGSFWRPPWGTLEEHILRLTRPLVKAERFPSARALGRGNLSSWTANHPEPKIFPKTGYTKFSITCQVILWGTAALKVQLYSWMFFGELNNPNWIRFTQLK